MGVCCDGCEHWLCMCQNRNSTNNFDANEFPYRLGPRIIAIFNFLVFAAFIVLIGVLGPKYGFAVNSTASLIAFIYTGLHVPPALLVLIARTRRWIFVGYCINIVLVIIDFLITAYVLVILDCSNGTNGTDCNYYISTSTPFNTKLFSMSITDGSFWPRMAAFFGGCALLSCCLCWCSCVPISDCCRRCWGCTRPDDGDEDLEASVVVASVDGAGVTVAGAGGDASRIHSFGNIELQPNPLLGIKANAGAQTGGLKW